MKKPKIVVFDLETLMDLPEIAKKYAGISQWPGKSMGADLNSIISFGYKIIGEGPAQCINIWDFDPNWAQNVNDDTALLHFISDTIGDDTDALVTHNGKRYDIKMLNARLAKRGLHPIQDIPHIDTCAVAKRAFKLSSNRLNDLAEFLGVEGKMQTGGWGLWVDVLNGSEEAANKMSDYCKQDVEATHSIMQKLLPHIKNMPNANMFMEDKAQVCPTCGSTNIQKHGIRRTKTTTYQRYRCNECGSTSQANKQNGELKSV